MFENLSLEERYEKACADLRTAQAHVDELSRDMRRAYEAAEAGDAQFIDRYPHLCA
jgi:hypothetical protein